MIQKRIVEIFIFVLYWFVLSPMIAVQCVQWGWVKWDDSELFLSIKDVCALALGLAAFYLVVYIIIVLIYLKLKTYSMKMWVTHNPAISNMINHERQYYDTNVTPMTELEQMNTPATVERENLETCGVIQQPERIQPLSDGCCQGRTPPPSYEQSINHV
ncbi:hypothetical protein AWZ03_009249 [Drosophila navojoa]|uniref:Uncharacterized protein n=1 Tax=Drosophila navojoa TaxID=7232 RepID=A0A484B6T5_DRONA|nr:uncharacterized protein LOC115563467 [Drosophila navojoa]TDG44359.1 hypothetical protein AWZ03_009249 [Drosophila navojoa]